MHEQIIVETFLWRNAKYIYTYTSIQIHIYRYDITTKKKGSLEDVFWVR